MALQTAPDLRDSEYWEMLVKKSVSRYFLLDALSKRPMHGYEIANTIQGCCEGWSRPTPGMIYPAIKDLMTEGYIDCTEEVSNGRIRKICHLTEKGREAHETAAGVWADVLPYLARSVHEATGMPQASLCCPPNAVAVEFVDERRCSE
ncbi:MAG: PadR family transcriptional regulator [SAR202 cluster bacterium]|jgi:DNA-binding PadR family transcriptional regulator|nr:PadR family transcriptional regulator [Chloroflexota bacterium]MDP6421543.1 PadR family transcriptional regulator [SAR202 cluster bacterium]MDP6664380.1 PadR family transcriptional regulator [SAR202 cluster bacterium]MDP6800423.1 PadR family transcriptional regulator [SAR202 cluster bacterium]MQG57540.1 PadR family transcriptional regulator [SAR202 cluster bacterium]|tara:strand:+ start:652 stop:1095 length:444 start_codon:yes stop_codon:yes gene_type:complete